MVGTSFHYYFDEFLLLRFLSMESAIAQDLAYVEQSSLVIRLEFFTFVMASVLLISMSTPYHLPYSFTNNRFFCIKG